MAAAAAQELPAEPRFRSWPITEVSALEPALKKMGLRVPAAAIDGTAPGKAGNCLSDALCSVGPAGRGGTGSFISADGLIITNHHVALDAVRQASTAAGKDYVQDGFVARSRDQEIAGPDYEVWITRSCEDVSAEILAVSKEEADPLKRANKVRDARQELARSREAAAAAGDAGKAAGLRCEVQEMWAMRTYVCFTYERLRDVRIVYVPPFALGCFGGDTDNFEWPRHTADFTLLRAYVAPDGSAAEPSPSNVPYKPTKFLRASPKGATEGDFIFILGFPGHTMRYAPSCRLAYSDNVAVPALVKDFGEKLRLIKEHAVDRPIALKLTSAKKSLANEHKRSSGKIVMMKRLGLVEERRTEEQKLCAAAPEAAEVLKRLAEIYEALASAAPLSEALDALQGVYAGSTLLAVGHALHEAKVEAAKPDAERETTYRTRNLPFLVKRLTKRIKDLHPPHEAALISRACGIARGHADISAAASALAKVQAVADAGFVGTSLPGLAAEDLEALLQESDKAQALEADPFVELAAQVYPLYVKDRDATKALLSERDQLLAKLLDIQKAHSDEVFYPDANSCLRLSAGHMEGYTAADAVYHKPMTTIGGLYEKHVENKLLGNEGDDNDFACPERLAELCKNDAAVRATPNCILYSTDTVGGNSGSPVLDADGNFVAINFDRQRLGLMNEFKWSPKYSRSIGTDVRYILWLVGTYDGAPALAEEMVGS